MGGFMLFNGETEMGVLARYTKTKDTWSHPSLGKVAVFKEMVRDGSIKLPTISEKEIQDRSKSDALSKCIVLGQTGWFVLQCIARKAQGLVITELELITLGLAVLNGFMYFCWWNKPFDVRTTVPVNLIPQNLRVPLVAKKSKSRAAMF
jgi:hypothetical protein